MSKHSRVFIQSLGINTASGLEIDEVYQTVFKEQKICSSELDLFSGRKTQVRQVKVDLPKIPLNLIRFNSRNNELLLHASLQLKSVIDGYVKRFGPERIGVVLGTSTSGIAESESAFIEKQDGEFNKNFNYYLQEIFSPSEFLKEYLGLKGICYSVSTACTSSAKSIIEGYRLLQSDLCDAVIVGGVDTLSKLTINGFDALDSISSELTNPLSVNRRGINIGEGAALFVLSKDEHEVEIVGYGESSDAYHMSSPDPEGKGAEMALRKAMEMARLTPEQISYVNMHATGTQKNDEMESRLIDRIFPSQVLVSGTKPYTGHTLGASAAHELALCYMALSSMNEKNYLPAHLWDGEQDASLPKLNLVKPNTSYDLMCCMSNSFAFGGNNVSIILRKNT